MYLFMDMENVQLTVSGSTLPIPLGVAGPTCILKEGRKCISEAKQCSEKENKINKKWVLLNYWIRFLVFFLLSFYPLVPLIQKDYCQCHLSSKMAWRPLNLHHVTTPRLHPRVTDSLTAVIQDKVVLGVTEFFRSTCNKHIIITKKVLQTSNLKKITPKK